MVVRQDEYIEHWGIRGMKWGHRRFQEYGGSARTTAGKIRYDEMPKGEKGSERAQKTARVRPSGSYANAKTSNKVSNSDKATKSLNKKSNNEEDNNSKTTKTSTDSKKNFKLSTASKVAIGVGAATLVGVGAYIGYKKISKRYVDKVLKAGLEMQTITTAENLDLGKRFYASFEKGDMRKYKYFYGKTLSNNEEAKAFWSGGQAKTIKSINTQLTKNLKIPSHDNAAKIFQKLYNEDSSFSKIVDQMNDTLRGVFDAPEDAKTKTFSKTKDRMTARILRTSGYDAFNIGLTFDDQKLNIPGITEAQNKFYKALKEAGYNAIQDINDQKYSGYHSKNPLIIFDSSNIIQKTVSELDMNDINANWIKVYGEIMSEDRMEKALNNYLRYAAIGGASTAAVGMTGRNIDKRLQNRNANRR